MSNLRTITITLELCFVIPKQRPENKKRLKMRHKHRNTHKNSGTKDKKKKNKEETDMVNFARPWSYSKKRQKLGTMRNYLFFQASCPPIQIQYSP